MKILVKFLSSPSIITFIAILWLLLLYSNHKFYIINCIISPFATLVIWWLNWKYIKFQSLNLKDFGKKTKIILYFLSFILDMLTWPLVLIRSSRIILEEDNV